MGVVLLFFIYWIQFWDYEYLMHTLNILSLNVTGFNYAVKRTCVLEHLHRKSISGALICNTTSSGTFLHMFWECPVVINLCTHALPILDFWGPYAKLCRRPEGGGVVEEWMKRICPCFTQSRIALAEGARETVSLHGTLSTRFFLLFF